MEINPADAAAQSGGIVETDFAMYEHGLWMAAPAKVNLTLEILGVRPDGYHDLRSVVAPLALADRVELRPQPEDEGVTLEVEADGVPIGAMGPAERNLAVRTANWVRSRLGVRAGVGIRIVKRIPLGGGLGGGSADAAAVINGLDRLWGLGLPEEERMALGAELGSDIPALVAGRAVMMEGRGERVTPLDGMGGSEGCDPIPIVLANPGVAVSTAEVYRNCDGCLTARAGICDNAVSSLRRRDLRALASSLFNGLETSVFRSHPEVGRLAGQLRAAGAFGVLMSGSGASVFGLVEGEAHGKRVLAGLPGDVWSRLTTILPDGVMAAHGPLEA